MAHEFKVNVLNLSGTKFYSSSIIITGQTGQFYASNNPSGFVTSGQLGGLNTGSMMTTGQTGAFASVANLTTTGAFLQSEIIIISGTTGAFITTSQTGQFYASNNPSVFVTSGQLRGLNTGSMITTEQTGQFAPNANTMLLTGNQNVTGIKVFNDYLNAYRFAAYSGATISVDATARNLLNKFEVIAVDYDKLLLSGGTWAVQNLMTSGQLVPNMGWVDQNYYPRTNPSGFGQGGPGGGGVSTITVDGSTISGAVTITGVGTVTALINGQTISLSGASTTINTGAFVDTGSNQIISGDKTFLGDILLSGTDLHIVNPQDTNYAIRATGLINDFYEIAIVNSSTGNNASTDFRAGLGSDPWSFLTDMGINSLNYTGYAVGNSGDGYIFHSGVDFYVGNITSGHNTILWGGHPLAGTTAQQLGAAELIIASGRVGVRTGTPVYQLDVQGTGNFTSGLRVSGQNVILRPWEFAKSYVLTNPDGIISGTYDAAVWRANKGCQATGLFAWRAGGSGAVVNAYKNTKATPLLAATGLSVNAVSGWVLSGVNNVVFAEGDTLICSVMSVTGLPPSISIQVEFFS